jgi:hypothetical protein
MEVFTVAYVPVYSQDMTLRELLMHPGEAGKNRVVFTAQGYSAIKKPHPSAVARDEAKHRETTFVEGWNLSDQNRRALQSMMAMADAHGFDLYVASSPLADTLVKGRDVAAYFDTQRSALVDLTSRSRRTHVILNPAVTYPWADMRTTDHVTEKLATDFTGRVAEAIASVERDR